MARPKTRTFALILTLVLSVAVSPALSQQPDLAAGEAAGLGDDLPADNLGRAQPAVAAGKTEEVDPAMPDPELPVYHPGLKTPPIDTTEEEDAPAPAPEPVPATNDGPEAVETIEPTQTRTPEPEEAPAAPAQVLPEEAAQEPATEDATTHPPSPSPKPEEEIKPAYPKAMGESVDVTVVVVARGSFGLLRNALRSISRELSEHKDISSQLLVVEAFQSDYLRRDALAAALSIISEEVHPEVVSLDGEPDARLARAFNRAAIFARGEALVFVDEAVEVSPGFLLSILTALKQGKGVAAVGCRLLNGDQTTVFHNGIEFSLGKIGRKYRYNADSDMSLTTRNVPLPFYALQGQSKHHPALLSGVSVVDAVGSECFAVRRQVASELGGFDVTLGNRFFLLDYSIRAKEKSGLETTLCADCRGVFLDIIPPMDEDTDSYEDEVKPFLRRWIGVLDNKINSRLQMKNVSVVWNMECGSGQTLGFTTEAINFVLALQDIVPLSVEVNNKQQCRDEMAKAGWPRCIIDSIARLSLKMSEYKENLVLVIHRDPGRYRSFISDRWGEPTPAHVVGRSMYETDKIPSEWVASCNNIVQQVWVPSEFNIQTFNRSGVNSSKIVMLHEPLDTGLYFPNVYSPLPLPGRKQFVFLSISKWEKRKGMDLLLRAYLEEFGESDSVSLFIRSNMDATNVREFEDLYASISKEKMSGPAAEQGLPQKPVILTSLIPVTKMPQLYAAANAFVLPSHGEGWGLPIIEAMAMGVPVIATNWSGSTEFLKEDNSNLVGISRLADATMQGHKWAEPSISDLRKHMRSVFNDKASAKKKASVARLFVENNFSQKKIAEQVLQKLRALEELPRFVLPPTTSHGGSYGGSYGASGTTYGGTYSSYSSTNTKPTKIKINP